MKDKTLFNPNSPTLRATTKEGIRVFDMTVPVDAYPGDKFEDWPANIQDGVMTTVEALGDHLQMPIAIVDSRADEDHDAPLRDGKKTFFIHVVISEVVMALPEQAGTVQ